MNRDYCLVPQYKLSGGIGGCGNPTRFVARHEDDEKASVFACGKHIAAALGQRPGKWIVVAVEQKN